jgi:selenocysteine lyase/cysteine desulfurase
MKLISAMEHHSNIVPWQMLCERTGAVLKVIPMNQGTDHGRIRQVTFRKN